MLSMFRKTALPPLLLLLLLLLPPAVGLASAAAEGGSEGAAVRGIPWRLERYTYVARQVPIQEVMASFSAAQGIGIILDGSIKAAVNGSFREVPSGEFLDRICAMHNLIWYYDGSALYLYRAGQLVSILLDLSYMKAGEVRSMLRELGMEDRRYPIATTSSDELIMVSGPPRYVALIQELVARADRLRQIRAVREEGIRIFRLHHAWAQDVSLNISGGNGTTVKGVANLLRDLMYHDGNGASGGSGARSVVSTEHARIGKPELTADEKAAEAVADRGNNILADSRLNAIIVRDSIKRLPQYEALIRELDVPVRMVEIAVTVLDIDREAVVDWELQIKALGRNGNVSGGIGSAAANGFLPGALEAAGGGLAGSILYVRNDVQLLSSLVAMEDKGRMRTVSRPSLLTLDNVSAELRDTKSYHAKVVGKEVAELTEVTAGITLSVQPRIVDLPVPAAPTPEQQKDPPPRYEIWMLLQIHDGGFDSIEVDGLPMSRSSTLETQAAVREGQSLLVGGYLRDIKEKRTWGVPFLRDIPYLGLLFGGHGHKNEVVQRMFLLTPRVITLDAGAHPERQAVALRDIEVERGIEDALYEKDILREFADRDQERRRRRLDDDARDRMIDLRLRQKEEDRLEEERRKARKRAGKAEELRLEQERLRKAAEDRARTDAAGKEQDRRRREELSRADGLRSEERRVRSRLERAADERKAAEAALAKAQEELLAVQRTEKRSVLAIQASTVMVRQAIHKARERTARAEREENEAREALRQAEAERRTQAERLAALGARIAEVRQACQADKARIQDLQKSLPKAGQDGVPAAAAGKGKDPGGRGDAERLRRSVEARERELAELREASREAGRRQAGLDRRIEEARELARRKQLERRRQDERLQGVQEELKALEKGRQEGRSRLEALERKLDEARRQYEETIGRLKQMEADQAKLQEEKRQAGRRLDDLAKDLAAKRDRSRDAERAIEARKAGLARQEMILRRQQEEFAAARKENEALQRKAREELKAAREKAAEARRAAQDIQGRVREARKEQERALAEAAAARKAGETARKEAAAAEQERRKALAERRRMEEERLRAVEDARRAEKEKQEALRKADAAREAALEASRRDAEDARRQAERLRAEAEAAARRAVENARRQAEAERKLAAGIRENAEKEAAAIREASRRRLEARRREAEELKAAAAGDARRRMLEELDRIRAALDEESRQAGEQEQAAEHDLGAKLRELQEQLERRERMLESLRKERQAADKENP